MLGRPKTGAANSALQAACARLEAHLAGSGAQPLAMPYLYEAETLLNLYGEDLRARAFIFSDPARGNELCLRPDFTIPVALAHGAGGWDRKAAYAYSGPVFRTQPQGQGRPVEYLQAGVERFGDTNEPETDAGVLALLIGGLGALGLSSPKVTIGDLAIPFALLDALDMPESRRAALRRHYWRPVRFQDLIRRSVSPPDQSPGRAELLATGGNPARIEGLMARAGDMVGMRDSNEIVSRTCVLLGAVRHPRMKQADADLIEAMLAIRGPARSVGERLRALGGPGGAFTDAIDCFDARLDAIAARGIDPAVLYYDATFGRNLEYYDGFVFEIRPSGGGTHPPLAGGGRYDAMTTILGSERPVKAIGGMIRPEAVLEVIK